VCDQIKIWSVASSGLVSDMTEPQQSLRGCNGRITALSFHPFAANILASADFGLDVGAVRVWQLDSADGNGAQVAEITGMPNPIAVDI
jgi:hypothetical protein